MTDTERARAPVKKNGETIMAYCRRGKNSDVYIYGGSELLECFQCSLSPGSFRTNLRSEMISHIKEHVTKGDKIDADSVINRLECEILEKGDVFSETESD